MNLFRGIPYPEEVSVGYWGIQTSTIDWCEENYVVSSYMAEALNTVTNAGFIALAFYAIRDILANRLEKRFLIASCGFALVGVGSWMFHMTLLYEYQLLDELPMIYATCVPYWSIFSFGKTRRGSIMVGIQVTVAAAVITAVYLYFQDPTIHQVAYAVLNVLIIIQSYILTTRHVLNQTVMKEMKQIMFLGVATFLVGYMLWNLDIHFCGMWRRLRRMVGMPYGFLLEGHAWWHLFTGLGVYYYIVYLEYLRVHLLGEHEQFICIWHFGIFPALRRVGNSNHTVKVEDVSKTQ
ncbi:alkaline ceramidase [Nadsonia fulvescens var. elongata DSM 6958]|uniref:Alkaline ceramidase n=1 Tax=Nadsonia fulvescens var. elongata DSM 6958 TaxID=857566 RepID=A0A1E3PH58_9ASCO|nr:alkaline ceramidase [Nadsonia fulvescens var. elongata DSM 6958]